MNNILDNFWTAYKWMCFALPPETYSFLIRANVALACPTIAAHIGFLNRWRHPAFQSLLIVIGILVGLGTPLGMFASQTGLRPWLTPIFVIGLVFLPHVFAFHCTPHFGAQKKLGLRIQIVILALFILNLV